MTANQFRAAIEKVGLSQQRAGLFFGRSGRTGQRWASGEYEVPDYVERFLKLEQIAHPKEDTAAIVNETLEQMSQGGRRD